MIHLLVFPHFFQPNSRNTVESTSKQQKKHEKSESFHNLYRKTINLTAGFPETVRRVDATVVVMDFWMLFGVDPFRGDTTICIFIKI